MNEQKNREQLHKLFDIVLDVNGMGARKREITGVLPTAFMSFSGHIAQASIRIYPDGWGANQDCELFEIYFDKDITDEDVEKVKGTAINALRSKNEEDVLIRQIEKAKSQLADQERSIARMRRRLELLRGAES